MAIVSKRPQEIVKDLSEIAPLSLQMTPVTGKTVKCLADQPKTGASVKIVESILPLYG